MPKYKIGDLIEINNRIYKILDGHDDTIENVCSVCPLMDLSGCLAYSSKEGSCIDTIGYFSYLKDVTFVNNLKLL